MTEFLFIHKVPVHRGTRHVKSHGQNPIWTIILDFFYCFRGSKYTEPGCLLYNYAKYDPLKVIYFFVSIYLGYSIIICVLKRHDTWKIAGNVRNNKKNRGQKSVSIVQVGRARENGEAGFSVHLPTRHHVGSDHKQLWRPLVANEGSLWLMWCCIKVSCLQNRLYVVIWCSGGWYDNRHLTLPSPVRPFRSPPQSTPNGLPPQSIVAISSHKWRFFVTHVMLSPFLLVALHLLSRSAVLVRCLTALRCLTYDGPQLSSAARCLGLLCRPGGGEEERVHMYA